jgi:hypothetical protein
MNRHIITPLFHMIDKFLIEQQEKCIIHCGRNIKMENTTSRKKSQKRNGGMTCQLMVGILRD